MNTSWKNFFTRLVTGEQIPRAVLSALGDLTLPDTRATYSVRTQVVEQAVTCGARLAATGCSALDEQEWHVEAAQFYGEICDAVAGSKAPPLALQSFAAEIGGAADMGAHLVRTA